MQPFLIGFFLLSSFYSIKSGQGHRLRDKGGKGQVEGYEFKAKRVICVIPMSTNTFLFRCKKTSEAR